MHYFPLALPFFLILFFIFVFLIILIEIGILGYAYEKIGVNRRYVFTLLFLSLIGSYVNIPVAEIPAKEVHSGMMVSFFGMRYIVPTVVNWPKTIIAVNLGGAVIPVALSLYIVFKNRLYSRSLLAVAIVAAVSYCPWRGYCRAHLYSALVNRCCSPFNFEAVCRSPCLCIGKPGNADWSRPLKPEQDPRNGRPCGIYRWSRHL